MLVTLHNVMEWFIMLYILHYITLRVMLYNINITGHYVILTILVMSLERSVTLYNIKKHLQIDEKALRIVSIILNCYSSSAVHFNFYFSGLCKA